MIQTDFFGDVNLGLYAKSCDKFSILGNILRDYHKDFERTVENKLCYLTLANTDFIGIFSALNSNGILVPKILTEKEIKFLSDLKKDLKINVGFVKTKFTALGNLILCNDNGAVISKLIPKKEIRLIQDVLDVEIEYSKIAGLNTVGSCGISTNKGCVVHRDATESEIKTIQDILKVDVNIGTVNFGSPFVGSGVVANSKGALIGGTTTGPEITRVQEALGFL